jgi:hypothetical protein
MDSKTNKIQLDAISNEIKSTSTDNIKNLQILLTWRDYAHAIQTKRQKMDNKNLLENNVNKVNAILDPNQQQKQECINKLETEIIVENNLNVLVVTSAPNSQQQQVNSPHLRQMMFATMTPSINDSNNLTVTYSTRVQKLNTKRREAVPDLNVPHKRWDPHNLKMIRRLYCIPVTIIVFICLLVVNCSTQWIYVNSNLSFFIFLKLLDFLILKEGLYLKFACF